MINWANGFSANTYAMVVDAGTWKDLRRIEIVDGSVSRTNEGLRNAADMTLVDYNQTKEQWLRIYMDVDQEGAGDHVALFTGLACAPDKTINGTLTTNKVSCNSVLQPCEDILLTRGWYAPARVDAETILRDLLSYTPAPVEVIDTTPSLRDHIVAEDGETALTMVEKVLLAIGWRMQIRGDGTIVISEPAMESIMLFDAQGNDCLETQLDVSYDWYSAPNVFRATTETESYIAKDENEDSILSIPSRGREIWVEETDCAIGDGETLQSYAERRLREEQMVNYQISYKRRFFPNILVSDIVTLNYPAQDIFGDFLITSQSIELGHGASTSEEVIAYEQR